MDKLEILASIEEKEKRKKESSESKKVINKQQRKDIELKRSFIEEIKHSCDPTYSRTLKTGHIW